MVKGGLYMFKGYYKIDECNVLGCTYELYENEKYGDEAPALVVCKNTGHLIGWTHDSIREFLRDYFSEDI